MKSNSSWAMGLGVGLAVLLIGMAELLWRWNRADFANVDFSGFARASGTLEDIRLFLPPILALVFLIVLVCGVAIAAGLAWSSPAAALAVAWGAGLFQVLTRIDILYVELAFAYVSFACAYRGGRRTRYAALVSIPVAAAMGWFFFRYQLYVNMTVPDALLSALDSTMHGGALLPVLAVASILALPWSLGMILRYANESRLSQEERDEAEEHAQHAIELARAHEQTMRLARDVHDVVGHSLTVILVQAQSAQLDPNEAQSALSNIAAVARSSLGEVRDVLGRTSGRYGEPSGSSSELSLEQLIETVSRTGVDVRFSASGTPTVLSPELEVTAHRVLQEMLTNAIKHGREGGELRVQLDWGDQLSLWVSNSVAGSPKPGAGTTGLGLPSMRQRLAAVGGFLTEDIAAPSSPGADGWYTVRAVVPVRRG